MEALKQAKSEAADMKEADSLQETKSAESQQSDKVSDDSGKKKNLGVVKALPPVPSMTTKVIFDIQRPTSEKTSDQSS